MTTHTLSPAESGVLAQHQAQLGQGLFHIQKCQACHQHIYFPREICPHCGSADVAFVTPSGLGTVYAVTTVRRKAADGGDYNVSLIDLDEGPRLMSRVSNCPPQAVHIDQRVQAHVVVTDGQGVVMFNALDGVAP
jgi:uncharacterized OB-fold protein